MIVDSVCATTSCMSRAMRARSRIAASCCASCCVRSKIWLCSRNSITDSRVVRRHSPMVAAAVTYAPMRTPPPMHADRKELRSCIQTNAGDGTGTCSPDSCAVTTMFVAVVP